MLAITYRATHTPDIFGRIATHFGEVAEGVREGRRIYDRYEKLARLSDAELARRDLSRQSIARAALTGR